MKKIAEFETLQSLAPGEIRHLVIEPHLDENESSYVALKLAIAPKGFEIIDLTWQQDGTGSSLLSKVGCLYSASIPRGSILLLSVKNITSLPCQLKGTFEFETAESAAPSLLDKCRRWFVAGFEVATQGSATQDRLSAEKSSPVETKSPLPSVRESARQIAASLASLVELPAMAAALYWRSLSEASLSEASLSEEGSAVDPQPIALERVSFPIDVFVAPNLGKCRYRLGEGGIKKIDLLGEWLTFTVDSIGGTEYEVDVILMPGTLIERVVGDHRTIAGT